MNLYQRLIAKYWWLCLILAIGAAAWAGWMLPGFAVEAGSDVLLNEDDEDLAYYNRTRADWVSDEYVIVCFHRKDGWFSKDALSLLNGFIREVRQLPQVRSITSMTTVPLLRILPQNMLGPTPVSIIDPRKDDVDPRVDLEKAREELLGHTQVIGNLLSENGQDASLLVYPCSPTTCSPRRANATGSSRRPIPRRGRGWRRSSPATRPRSATSTAAATAS
jgi:hypothetical protein